MIRSLELRRNEAAVPMRSEALRGRPAIPVFVSRPASRPEYSRTVLPRRVLMKCLESPAMARQSWSGLFIAAGLTDQNVSAIAATTAALAANIRMATASGRIIAGMIGALYGES
jgi:hypothetical protein